MHFEFLSLKLFVTVYEQRSMARAAEIEHIAASAVSKRISDLEKTIRAPLFYRRPNGLEPTPVAQSLLQHARGVLRDLSEMEVELSDYTKGFRGQVRIHASVSPLVQHLPKDIADFLELYPLIRIELQESISPDVVRAVAENEADIGIFGGDSPAGDLHVVPYRTDGVIALVPAGHPLSSATRLKFAEIAEHEIIGPRPGGYLDSLILFAAADLGHQLKIRIRLNGFETAASMVEAGLGVAFATRSQAQRFLATRALVAIPVDETWAVRQWKLCTRALPLLIPPARLLLGHLSSRFKMEEIVGGQMQPARETIKGASTAG